MRIQELWDVTTRKLVNGYKSTLSNITEEQNSSNTAVKASNFTIYCITL
jgi:hypothetical protein